MPKGKPFPNEHAARQIDPKQFKAFRRMHKAFPTGIDAIFGLYREPHKKTKTALQALRFRADKWSPSEARAWLKAHKLKSVLLVAKSAKRKR